MAIGPLKDCSKLEQEIEKKIDDKITASFTDLSKFNGCVVINVDELLGFYLVEEKIKEKYKAVGWKVKILPGGYDQRDGDSWPARLELFYKV